MLKALWKQKRMWKKLKGGREVKGAGEMRTDQLRVSIAVLHLDLEIYSYTSGKKNLFRKKDGGHWEI